MLPVLNMFLGTIYRMAVASLALLACVIWKQIGVGGNHTLAAINLSYTIRVTDTDTKVSD